MNKFLFLLALPMALNACKKESNAAPEPAAETITNVAYGTHAQQTMDIYLPAKRTAANTHTILLLHGGSWVSGDKADLNFLVDSIKRRFPQMAIANINYRLAAGNANLFPAALDDVNKAVQYIKDHSSQYQVSTKGVIMGASAGGHLALLHAYKANSNNYIQAVISLFGPTDITALYNNGSSNPLILAAIRQTLTGVFGTTPAANPSVYENASPVKQVTPQSPPTLLLHGTADMLVPIEQSRALYQVLQAAQVPSQLAEYPGLGHDYWPGAPTSDALQKITTFLEQYLH